ncbi:MAG: PASTA domain-containing protein [Chitinivibrionales bacterium]|nr:PASTA domain-containing protein [Chitinivibrionales bacterium]MBD3355706.1 PASTA domain-containing protein [Chitinivibrionales bacterium]
MKVFRARLIFVQVLLGLGVLTVLSRLFVVQIIHAKEYAAQSRRQSTGRRVIRATRGAIRDRRGRALAANTSHAQPTRLRNTAQQIGSNASVRQKRLYPHGELAGAVLGYVGRDGYGLGGAEFAFDEKLRGEDGWAILQRDGRNKRYSRIGLPHKKPINGSDVYLTLDLWVQKIARNVLAQTTAELNARGGMCIVMDPSTGHILAMVNEPGFNPNEAGRYPLAQRKNRCISYNYEPGSTFKVIPAASALQEKTFGEHDTLDGNNGVFEIYDQVIRDHTPYGYLEFAEALAYSSNVCFARIANALGNDRLYKYARDFGLGAQTGIVLPGEENGIVHPINRWSGRTRVTMAIGQEVSATFLQMIMVFAAIADDGVLREPLIYDKVVSAEGEIVERVEPRAVRRVISATVASRLRRLLSLVVEKGTGRRAAVSGVELGGKTGTSQKYDRESGTYSSDRLWSSFIGFVPVERPVLVCGVLIDEPEGGEAGGSAAAPAFREIIQQIISHPELEFAEKILRSQENLVPEKPGPTSVTIPLISGLNREGAAALLHSYDIDFEIIGSGDTILHQSPSAGEVLADNGRVIGYANDFRKQSLAGNAVRVPNCVGKDLRDAVNVVNVKGLIPYVNGAGTVIRQYPTVGALVEASAVCTLHCSFEG